MNFLADNWEALAGLYAFLVCVVRVYHKYEDRLSLFVAKTSWRGDNWLLSKVVSPGVSGLSKVLDLVAVFMPKVLSGKKTPKL